MPHSPQLQKMDENDVRTAYRRWAPVYDATFGKLVTAGMRHATKQANRFSGRLLDVGVGTGDGAAVEACGPARS